MPKRIERTYPTTDTALDRLFMRRALRLAGRGRGLVSPNPMVGAVVVRRGQVIGEGWHRRYGGAHAEVEAIRAACSAAGRARGATLYVTLEPCAHHGKTPPCVDAIRDAGISRVVVAMRDPNPKVLGGGLEVLRSRGVDVLMGPCAAEAAELNRGFIACVTTGRPLVTVKLAASLDGGIATASGHSRWITSPEARREAHRLRSEHDAVLVGAATVMADDPALTVRHVRGRNPTRIVLDPLLRSSPRAAWLADDGVPCVVVARAGAPLVRRKAFEAAGAEVWIGPASPGRSLWRGIRIGAFLKQAARAGITSILVEGGGRMAGAFLAAKCADRLALFTAPILLGGDSIRWTHGLGVSRVDRAPRVSDVAIKKLGPDWLVTGDL